MRDGSPASGTSRLPTTCCHTEKHPDSNFIPGVNRKEIPMRVGFALGNIGPIGTAENLIKIARRALKPWRMTACGQWSGCCGRCDHSHRIQ
jgi:hypothetical protein